MGGLTKLMRLAIGGIAAALSMSVDPAFASCNCLDVDLEEVVKHATGIALIRVTKAEVAKAGCGGPGQSSCGIDVVVTAEYLKGTGPSDGEFRITNTDPYFCGFSLKVHDEFLDVEGASLGAMTQICVLYATLNNHKLIDQFRAAARRGQSRAP
ncbi:MAG: hypothetical protein IBJ17_16695 [Reyranella sp.]|nr:hypothetical protein [Reyranella sp.]